MLRCNVDSWTINLISLLVNSCIFRLRSFNIDCKIPISCDFFFLHKVNVGNDSIHSDLENKLDFFDELIFEEIDNLFLIELILFSNHGKIEEDVHIYE